MTKSLSDATRNGLFNYLSNAAEVIDAYTTSSRLPPLKLKTGITIEHRPADAILSLFVETYVRRYYTAEGFYEPQPGDRVVDAGAHIGVFSLYLTTLAADIRTFCFEPSSQTREVLRKNIINNGLEDTITSFPVALWSKPCRRQLGLYSSTQASSLHPRIESTVLSEYVQCISLSQAISMCSTNVIDLLKLDVEGAEADILRGGADLDWSLVRRVALEYHDDIQPLSRGASLEILASYGFCSLRLLQLNPTRGFLLASRG